MEQEEAEKMTYSAEELSRAGDQYLGRSYEEMDCQEFVEQCLRDIGITLDLKGSNAWYRKCLEEGWAGSPEDCVKTFGCVPKGAFLFIHAFDGGEKKRGYRDGKGNASHIGLKTGRGDGAIHSSASRGCVATSQFRDRTIRNGGWNTVGLWKRLDYGKTVNWLLEHMGIGSGPAEDGNEEDKTMKVTVSSPNGGTVNLRKAPDKGAALVERIPNGTEAELLEGGDVWSRIRAAGRTGWMMTEFLAADESAVPDEDFGSGDLDGPDPAETVSLRFTVAELNAMRPYIQQLLDAILDAIGRG